MTILSRLDAWLGKTLFHPPIIVACQITRQTQYAMHRALWFFAACHATYYWREWGLAWTVFIWCFALAALASAVVAPDRPAVSAGVMRFTWWIIFSLGAVHTLISGEVHDATVRALIILFAEYAATIKTIPPRRKREQRTSAKEAQA